MVADRNRGAATRLSFVIPIVRPDISLYRWHSTAPESTYIGDGALRCHEFSDGAGSGHGMSSDPGPTWYRTSDQRFPSQTQYKTRVAAALSETGSGDRWYRALNPDPRSPAVGWAWHCGRGFQGTAWGAAARAAVPDVVDPLAGSADRGCNLNGPLERYRAKGDCSSKLVDAYRQDCRPIASVSDLKFAPFHILASEGAVHTDIACGGQRLVMPRIPQARYTGALKAVSATRLE